MSTDDFFLGRLGSPVHRRQVFANRTKELAALLQRTMRLNTSHRSLGDLRNYERQAANVAVVYGRGGIGKSALLNRVTESFVSMAPDGQKRCAVSVDLGHFANQDFETILIRIRSAFARLHDQWPAFDLAFTYYWQLKHPGSNVVTFLGNAGFLSLEERKQVVEQVTGGLDSLLGGFGIVGAGYRIMTGLRERAKQSRAVLRIREEFPPFARLMDESDPDAILPFLGTLLAYDLQVARRGKDIWTLCVLDTFETVQNLPAERGGLEDLVARLVYLIPNMPFLVGTRVPLDWYEPRREPTLFYGGRTRWECLLPGGEQAQLAIEGLDEASATRLLEDSLMIGDQPAMPALVRNRVVRGSYGLPLYLELSINWYRQLLQDGRADGDVEVASSFPELVLHLIRDLSARDRDLLRAAALLEVFNPELLAHLLPDARQVEINRFLARTFVVRSPEGWLPYSLHQVFRHAIVEHDEYTPDAWTAEEWRGQATRALDWMAGQALAVFDEEQLAAPGRTEEIGRRCVAALLLSMAAIDQYSIAPDRLGELAFAVRNLGYIRAFDSLTMAGQPPDSDVARLVRVASVSSGNGVAPMRRLGIVRDAMRYDSAGTIDHFIASELGIIAEVVGEHETARRAYEFTLTGPAAIGEFGALGLAYNHLRSGRLKTALEVSPERSRHPFFRSSALDFRGHVFLHGGEFDRSVGCFRESTALARSAGSPLLLARGLRHIALSAMWYDPDVVLGVVAEALEMNKALGEDVGVAQCEMATALAHAWLGNWADAWSMLEQSRSHGLDALAIGHPWMVETFLRRALGDEDGTARAAAAVFSDERVTRTDAERPHVWYAVTALFAGRPDLADFSAVEWYDSSEQARARWEGSLERMRRRLAA